MNLAQRLVKAGVLEPEQLAPALFRQKKSRGFLAKHLLDLKLVEPEVLAEFVYAYPPMPETFEDLGLPKGLLIQLLLKHCLLPGFHLRPGNGPRFKNSPTHGGRAVRISEGPGVRPGQSPGCPEPIKHYGS